MPASPASTPAPSTRASAPPPPYHPSPFYGSGTHGMPMPGPMPGATPGSFPDPGTATLHMPGAMPIPPHMPGPIPSHTGSGTMPHPAAAPDPMMAYFLHQLH
eukprot:5147191-Ditylum_brightwellii.AAC.1